MDFVLPGADSPAIVAISIPLLYVVAVALGRWLKRRHRVPLGVMYQLFAVALAVWLPLLIAGIHRTQHWAGMRHLAAAVAMLATLFVLALVHRYFWEGWFERKQQIKAPKFLRQIFTMLLFVAALLWVLLYFGYTTDISAALTASGAAAVVLGFAMQETLANIVSGVALEIGKPFKTGDWLIVDKQHAEVIEVNWRSTRLRTNDDIYLDIPNKTIVGTTITNLTYPTRQHAMRITIGFDYGAPPNFVKDCMMRAATSAAGVLSTPPVKVFLKDFGDSAVLYEIKFTMDDESRFNDICDAIRTNVWYEAQRSGLRIPFPIRTLQIDKPKVQHDNALTAAKTSVRKQPMLQLLEESQVDKLLLHAKLLRFGRGERVIVQGQKGDSMFILLNGEADVLVHANGTDTRVATLRTGDACGEMSLLTGEPRSATVVASTDCQMWEIDKAVLGEILAQNQPLVQRLGEMLAKRRVENEGLLASTIADTERKTKEAEYTQGFLRKLYSFFEL